MNFFQITLGSFMKRRGIASHKLLSVLVNCQTPNNVFAQGREKLFRSGPIYTSVPRRETRMNSRAAHTKTEERKRKKCGCCFMSVSVGLLREWRHTPNIARARPTVCEPAPRCQYAVPGCCPWQSVFDTNGSTGCLADCVTRPRRSRWRWRG